ncbi:hypothetical protein Dred_0819 [Desulforamulus reducens MI-1]|uniref:Uncharacterized protein n=1 Tax=Desulforamulus reducens (strain ATCC BAA-1160 / DSM 100696 / MI-1) TaxID=349161 RepID=A4J2Q4_DESRM|nr:hypothetical protein [Desulforamulus reducens]ABO49357.1 hypothetical protein Dred_0819 [Desulforamulus reducens MI-1]
MKRILTICGIVVLFIGIFAYAKWPFEQEVVTEKTDQSVAVEKIEKQLNIQMTKPEKANFWDYQLKDKIRITYDEPESIAEVSISVFSNATTEDVKNTCKVLKGYFSPEEQEEIAAKILSIYQKKKSNPEYDERWEHKYGNRRVNANAFWNDQTALMSVLIFKEGK